MLITVHRPNKEYKPGQFRKAVCGLYSGAGGVTLELVLPDTAVWSAYKKMASRTLYKFCEKCKK